MTFFYAQVDDLGKCTDRQDPDDKEKFPNKEEEENLSDKEFEDKYMLHGFQTLDLSSNSDYSDDDFFIESDDEENYSNFFSDDDNDNVKDLQNDDQNRIQINVNDNDNGNNKQISTNLSLEEVFRKDFHDFFSANFLTLTAKEKIKSFVERPKYSKLSLDKKCAIINIARKTLYNYNKKDMLPKKQIERNKNKGRDPKLTEEELNLFIQKCKEMRDEKVAVTTKWARKIIKGITKENGHEWMPCKSTVSYIFRKNGWHRRKSQHRNPQSDPDDKDEKIENFRKQLKEIMDKCKEEGKEIKRKMFISWMKQDYIQIQFLRILGLLQKIMKHTFFHLVLKDVIHL